MTNFTNKTFKETYRDYYDQNDNYHKVLFNSGRALQARELNEAQTIIQEELSRLGRNLFREGAVVRAGASTSDNTKEYIRLEAASLVPEDIVGQEYQNAEGVKFIIEEFIDAVDLDPATLYVKYTDTTTVSDTTEAPRVKASDVLTPVGATTFPLTVATDGTIPATGVGTKVSVSEGEFFVLGHFVHIEDSSTFIDKYSATPTVDFGFRIEQLIITEGEDDKLYDNQGDFPNTTAPGAHRYQINLLPTTRDQVAEDENFVFVCRLVDGVISRDVDTNDAYNVINDLLAVRTKEESGDYIAKDFKTIVTDLDEDNLNLEVTAGTAYVDGYRLDFDTTNITVPKSRATTTVNNDSVTAEYGNYVIIDETTSSGLPALSTFGLVDLWDATDTIGQANVRGIENVGGVYHLYLFNIQMDDSKNFRDVASINEGTVNLVDSTLYGSSNNTLLFPLSNTRPQAITDVNYTAQRTQEITSDASGEILLGGTVNASYSTVIFETDGSLATGWVVSGNSITGLTASTPYVVTYYQEIPNPTLRSKVLTTVTEEGLSLVAGDIQGPYYIDEPRSKAYWRQDNTTNEVQLVWGTVILGYVSNPANSDTVTLDGFTYTRGTLQEESAQYDRYEISRFAMIEEFVLDYADGIELISIVDQDGNDYTDSYEFDGGQRDNFYGSIKIKPKTGFVPEVGLLFDVTFSHFAHTNGNYFSVESYDIPYSEIPTYKLANNSTVRLTNVLDFRPVVLDSGIEFNLLPKNKSIISVDATYYLPRIDTLVANTVDSKGRIGLGELQLVQGDPSLSAVNPSIPTGSLDLFTFTLNPYTFNENDLSKTKIPHKRFTMKDIAQLEERVENLYELTTLSLLEADTNTLVVLDENGNNRTKSGFIADNFTSLSFADVENSEFRASIDLNSGQLQPSFREHSVRLVVEDALTTAQKSTDIITLPYTSEVLTSQKLASGTLNVNPFAVITQTGHTTLSPETDIWVETAQLPDVVQTTIRRNNVVVGSNPRINRTDFLMMEGSDAPRNTGIVASRAITSPVIQDFIGERVLGVEVVPFMRSRKVYFKSEGLRPNTKMFAFFGGVPVADWVRQESTFVTAADNTVEFGSEFASASGHPEGATELTTNAAGELIGSFFIPSSPTLNFRVGEQEFKLLDVSVNDDAKAICNSSAIYESRGTIETVQRTVRATRPVRRARWSDPLAQSFIIDQTENPNGLFLSKVSLYLESKDDTIPLRVEVRPVENGIPTNYIVPGSVKYIHPNDITVTPYTETTELSTIQANPTIVEFNEPIYFTSGEEYAIILLAESVEYNTYVAETYEYLIGVNNREGRVNKQPTLGSLFLSQNGSTWTPDQTKDLMFELHRAEFFPTGHVHLVNANLPKVTLGSNPITKTKDLSTVFIHHEGHGFVVNDSVSISGTTFIAAGNYTIQDVTWKGYTIDTGIVATTTITGGGTAVVASHQVMYDEFIPNLDMVVPVSTNVVADVHKTSGASYGMNRNDSILNSAYSQLDWERVALNNLNRNTAPSLIANGTADIEFNVQLSTTDTKVSPVIDLQRASLLALENVIDTDDAAQHITTPIILDESAVGLKVLFAANRQSAASFDLYVKTAPDESGLLNAEWNQTDIEVQIPSDENLTTFREYSYIKDELDPFTIFQVKLVMKSTNSSKSPVITDFRTIALAV